MSDYTLYKANLSKPYMLLKLDYGIGSKEWLIPDNKKLDFRNHKRLAFENPRPSHGEHVEPGYIYDELDKGELDLVSETEFKIEFFVWGCGKYDGLNGRYVLMVPSWGRKTNRRTWVLIPA